MLGTVAVNSLRSRSHLGEDWLGGTTHSLGVQLDLLERETELAGVAGLIDALPDGGRLVAIEGPPGIGKTALLAQARALGQESGLQVLGANEPSCSRARPRLRRRSSIPLRSRSRTQRRTRPWRRCTASTG